MDNADTAAGIRVGILDSGVASSAGVEEQVAFAAGLGGVVERRAFDSGSAEHGTLVARTIRHRAPGAVLLSAQVFRSGHAGIPAVVAAGLDWLVAAGAGLVNMSFGLLHDREVLREACGAACARGVLLVAPVPARGAVTFPAAYRGVIRVTGDARCAPGELSWLGDERAHFGACVGGVGHRPHEAGGGASVAAAHFSGELASALVGGLDSDAALEALRRRCRHVGRERRGT